MADILIVIRGTRVAIKRVNLHQVSLNRHMLIELKAIKDLQHDNLVRFYGACMACKRQSGAQLTSINNRLP